MQTLATSQLLSNREYFVSTVQDLSAKLEHYEDIGRKGIGLRTGDNLERTVLDA